jgi:hypothetical protein
LKGVAELSLDKSQELHSSQASRGGKALVEDVDYLLLARNKEDATSSTSGYGVPQPVQVTHVTLGNVGQQVSVVTSVKRFDYPTTGPVGPIINATQSSVLAAIESI